MSQTEETSAPGLGALLEGALTAPAQAGEVLRKMAAAPVPGYGPMLGTVAAFAAGGLALNAVRDIVAGGGMLPALAGGAALIITVLISFPAAGLLHLAARLSGGTGSFARTYQALALASGAALLQPLLGGFPALWALPGLLAAYVCARGLIALHGAVPARAWASVGALAALVVAGQWTARRRVEAALQTARAVQQVQTELQRTALQLGEVLPLVPGAEQAATAGPRLAQPGQLPASGLDLLAGPQGAVPDGGPAEPGVEDPSKDRSTGLTPQKLQTLQTSAASMLQTLEPLFSNPAVRKNLSPAQAKQMDDLMAMMKQQQQALSRGGRMSPEEQARFMAQMQQLQAGFAGMMMMGAQPPQGGGQARPPQPPAPPGGQR